MEKNSKILILGANGMVGTALQSTLRSYGHTHVACPRSANLNLLNQQHTLDFMIMCKFEYVFFLAAKVGGIMANMKNPATFGYENAQMALNVIHASKEAGVKKLLFMGSSCIYPRECPQPMKEEYFLTGALEPTNEMYALAKIFGLKLCDAYNKQFNTNFISCMPCNIYGPHDNFNLATSHVVSAFVQKFHDAKTDNKESVTCFGTGSAKREFIHVEDVAQACYHLMLKYNDQSHINVGVGEDISIYDLALLVAKIVGYTGKIEWDVTKPDGMPRKILDITKIINTGWTPTIKLEQGLSDTYKWFLENYR